MNLFKLLAVTGVTALLGAGAFAQPGGPRDLAEKADANQDGKLTFEEITAVAPEFTRERFDALDRNGDGVLSPADREAGPRSGARPGGAQMLQRLRAADTDGDGKVTKDEFKAAFPQAPARLFERLDTNKDGVICPKDAAGARQGRQPWRGEGSLAERLKAADTDGDGVLSRDEFKAAFPRVPEARFDALDTDGDGKLTRSELAEGRSRSPRERAGRSGERKDAPQVEHGEESAVEEAEKE